MALVAAALIALGAPGCGDEDETEGVVRRAETAQPVPGLPAGWSVHRNAKAGFALGVPPAWRAENHGIRSLVRSPDRLVAATISADRTTAGLEFPLDEFAETAITGVEDIRDLEPGETRRFRHRYEAAAVEAEGEGGKEDLRQKLLLVVARREGIATLIVLVARNAEQATARYTPQVERMIRSLRSRPPA